MLRAFLLACWLAAPALAQERQATVTLDSGRVIVGTVVAIDLVSVQLRVGDELVTLGTDEIRSCHFVGGAPDGGPPASTTPGTETRAAGSSPSPEDSAGGGPAGPRAASRPRLPLPDPVVEGASEDDVVLPHDLRNRSRFRARMEGLDEAYPWLVPAEPTQWASLGLLLFASLTLVVHLSTSVVGAEGNGVGRCMAVALWYLLTTILQVALVPTAHLSTFIMLVANTAMALFWLRNLFGLSRGAAVIAFAVQLGFVVLGYGVLELVGALLASIGTSQA